MNLTEDYSIHISSSSIYVRDRINKRLTNEYILKLKDFPEVREAVRELVLKIVEQEAINLFPDICGRCGNCCHQLSPVIHPSLQEKIATFLNISHTEFITAYTQPAATWNRYDVYPQKKNGACIFLEKEEFSGDYKCKIYPERPEECREYRANSPLCQKEYSSLIKNIVKILIDAEKVYVSVAGLFQVEEVSLATPLIKENVVKLLAALRKISPQDQPKEEYAELLEEAKARTKELLSLSEEKEKIYTEEFRTMVEEVSQLVARLSLIILSDDLFPGELDKLFSEVEYLKYLVSEVKV